MGVGTLYFYPNGDTAMPSTIRLHRVLKATPDRAYRAFPVEACYLGWQESLTLLAKLVEAEIPD